MTIFAPAVSYWAIVFGAGFLLGVSRTLWVAPAIGEMWAELGEMPIMFAVVVLASRSIVQRFGIRSRVIALEVGLLALALLIAAELALVVGLRQMSVGDYLDSRNPVSGTVYLVMLLVFAAMPWWYVPRHAGPAR